PAEGGALAYLEKLLGDAGFETHRVTFSDKDTPDVENLYARIGEGAPHLTFAGHTDVVPTGDETLWRFPPFSAEVAESRVWGRGACDMKGGIAAFAAAALRHVEKHGKPRGTISLLITGDEEGPAINGTVKLLEWADARGEKFSHAIVGEPTNPNALGDMIKIGRRGSLNGDITVVGRQGHSAYPQQADNPIPTLARIVTALSAAPLDDGNAAFDPTRLVVTSFDVGNSARNVIPGEASAKFNVRFNDIWTPESLAARIREIVAEAAQGADARVKIHPTNSISFRTQRSGFTDMVVAAIEKQTGRTPELSTTGGTSDARFITNYCPVLEFGLVGKTIHATDENVEVADLDKLADIYGEILERYFG
ncbi:MAG: succinyl-diaminopimelate desuccinylase, partial [Hyphomicrobiales bacterium]|nr:succinyl-diaminopimelate desuccinylase [Hyphomicrobiales bacterium]